MSEGETIHVLIADDHDVVREGVNALLTHKMMHVVAEARNGIEAVEMYRLHRPDITLMDLRMPLMDGLAATRAIVAEFPQARIIILTSFDDEEQNSLQAGAVALIQKDAPARELIGAIHAAHCQIACDR